MDKTPRKDAPQKHFLIFQAVPSDAYRVLNRSFDNRLFMLNNAKLPKTCPIQEVTTYFQSWSHENPTWFDTDAPKHESAYELRTRLTLKKAQVFSEPIAKKILESFQLNTGDGEYRQLPNGQHQIVIKDKKSTTVMELSYYNIDKGIEYIGELLNGFGLSKFQEEYYEEEIKKLRTLKETSGSTNPPMQSIDIVLRSNQNYRSGLNKDDNREIRGETSELRVSPNKVEDFMLNVSLLTQAVSDSLGGQKLPNAEVLVDIKDITPEPEPDVDEPETEKTQSFSEFTRELLSRIKAKDVVEIGPDVELGVASRVSSPCEHYYAVALPSDVQRMKNWYELRQSQGMDNVDLISGNAIRLSEIVKEADAIIIHNVTIDGSENFADTRLLLDYGRGKVKYTEKDWKTLIAKLRKTKKDAYQEFMRVAKKGYIIEFMRKENVENHLKLLTQELGVPAKNIEEKELLCDEADEDTWVAVVVNNTQN